MSKQRWISHVTCKCVRTNARICIHVHKYIHIYVHIYNGYVYVYVCVYTYIYIYVCIQGAMLLHSLIDELEESDQSWHNLYIYVCVFIYICTYMYTCIYMYIYVYIYIYICIQRGNAAAFVDR